MYIMKKIILLLKGFFTVKVSWPEGGCVAELNVTSCFSLPNSCFPFLLYTSCFPASYFYLLPPSISLPLKKNKKPGYVVK